MKKDMKVELEVFDFDVDKAVLIGPAPYAAKFAADMFWALFSVGFFPFLVRDARAGDYPLNCVLLCTVLICAPLLRVRNLRIVFSVSTVVNLLAAWYARGSGLTFQYTLELAVINAVAFFMAQNLHDNRNKRVVRQRMTIYLPAVFRRRGSGRNSPSRYESLCCLSGYILFTV